MSQNEFDVIVIGAGMAGLVCAGELVLEGARPLLICETEEVASTFKTTWVAGQRGMMQAPTWQVAWGGGWWFQLARRLNIPVVLHPEPGMTAAIYGGQVHRLDRCVSAAAMTETFARLSPIPLGDAKPEFERVMHLGLTIPYQQLVKMDRVPLIEWLKEQGADDFVTMLLLTVGGSIAGITLAEAYEQLSVLGAFGCIRSYFCCESLLPAIAPDCREGLLIPMAKEIERRGGEVWRGRKVHRVTVDGDRVGAVVLEDGTEVRAPVVALAGGNSRIEKLFDTLPPEIVEPLAYSRATAISDFCTFVVVDNDVMGDLDSWLIVLNPEGDVRQYSWPLHQMAPWTTEPGKQFLVTQKVLPASRVEVAGGAEAIYKDIVDVNDTFFPGFKDSIVDMVTTSHKHLWYNGLFVGPKLPRTVESVEGLYFVGDGSVPTCGIAVEMSASTGALGARAIVKAHKGKYVAA